MQNVKVYSFLTALWSKLFCNHRRFLYLLRLLVNNPKWKYFYFLRMWHSWWLLFINIPIIPQSFHPQTLIFLVYQSNRYKWNVYQHIKRHYEFYDSTFKLNTYRSCIVFYYLTLDVVTGLCDNGLVRFI